MSEKSQHTNVLLAILCFVVVVIAVAVIGFFALGNEPEYIQGQMDVTEYRVSSKVPGRIVKICKHEGDYVHVGDTLAILDAPEVRAKSQQASAVVQAASAMSEMAQNGARQEQVQGAYQLWQQAKAALEISDYAYVMETGTITMSGEGRELLNDERVKKAYLGE